MKWNSTLHTSWTLLLLAGCSSVQNTTSAQQTNHMSQSVYLLEYSAAQRFHQATLNLQTSLTDFCIAKADKRQVQSSWQEAFDQWMFLQGQERGPIRALEQNWNIQFWPDKKNTSGRKMVGLLARNQPITASEISQQSVAVQGLGAMEWLLYDLSSPLTQPQSGDLMACQLGSAITQNLVNNSEIIYQAWEENPWRNLDPSVWLSEYISLLSNQLAFAESKLVRPMANIGVPRPYFAEAWRSRSSLRSLEKNIEALQRLYHADRNGLDNLLRQRGFIDLAERVDAQFTGLLQNWPPQPDLFDFLQTQEGYREALGLKNKIEQLNYLINREVAVSLGVVIGFNSTDGD